MLEIEKIYEIPKTFTPETKVSFKIIERDNKYTSVIITILDAESDVYLDDSLTAFGMYFLTVNPFVFNNYKIVYKRTLTPTITTTCQYMIKYKNRKPILNHLKILASPIKYLGGFVYTAPTELICEDWMGEPAISFIVRQPTPESDEQNYDTFSSFIGEMIVLLGDGYLSYTDGQSVYGHDEINSVTFFVTDTCQFPNIESYNEDTE